MRPTSSRNGLSAKAESSARPWQDGPSSGDMGGGFLANGRKIVAFSIPGVPTTAPCGALNGAVIFSAEGEGLSACPDGYGGNRRRLRVCGAGAPGILDADFAKPLASIERLVREVTTQRMSLGRV